MADEHNLQLYVDNGYYAIWMECQSCGWAKNLQPEDDYNCTPEKVAEAKLEHDQEKGIG